MMMKKGINYTELTFFLLKGLMLTFLNKTFCKISIIVKYFYNLK